MNDLNTLLLKKQKLINTINTKTLLLNNLVNFNQYNKLIKEIVYLHLLVNELDIEINKLTNT